MGDTGAEGNHLFYPPPSKSIEDLIPPPPCWARCDWEPFQVVLGVTNEELAGSGSKKRRRRARGNGRRWNSILERQIPLRPLSSSADPFEHQSSSSRCLTQTSYRLQQLREDVCLFVCLCLWSASISQSLCVRVTTSKTQRLYQRGRCLIWSPPTSWSPSIRSHCFLLLFPFLLLVSSPLLSVRLPGTPLSSSSSSSSFLVSPGTKPKVSSSPANQNCFFIPKKK